MSRVNVEAWKCDLCNHVWYKHGKEPPPRCANCKRPNWDLGGKVESGTAIQRERNVGHRDNASGRKRAGEKPVRGNQQRRRVRTERSERSSKSPVASARSGSNYCPHGRDPKTCTIGTCVVKRG